MWSLKIWAPNDHANLKIPKYVTWILNQLFLLLFVWKLIGHITGAWILQQNRFTLLTGVPLKVGPGGTYPTNFWWLDNIVPHHFLRRVLMMCSTTILYLSTPQVQISYLSKKPYKTGIGVPLKVGPGGTYPTTFWWLDNIVPHHFLRRVLMMCPTTILYLPTP